MQVVYRGPGDHFVPDHPGNTGAHNFFVWLKRRAVPARRGRVAVDLGRVVLRLVSKDSGLVRRPCRPPARARGGIVDTCATRPRSVERFSVEGRGPRRLREGRGVSD